MRKKKNLMFLHVFIGFFALPSLSLSECGSGRRKSRVKTVKPIPALGQAEDALARKPFPVKTGFSTPWHPS